MKKINAAVRKRTGHGIGTWMLSLLVLLFIIIDLTPLYFILVNSLKAKPDYLQSAYRIPETLYFDNYIKLLKEYNFPQMFKNSIILTLVSIFICGYLGTMAAFAVGKFNFKGRSAISVLIIPLMSIPGIVLLIPLFVLFSKMGMTNTFFTVIFIYIGLLLPFTINMMSGFMSSVPNGLLEAAMIDGCGFLKMFHKIVVPLVAPGFSAASIVNAMWIWNELLIVFIFMQNEAKRTLIVGLTSLQGLYNLDVPLLMAGAAVTSLPIIFLYILSQRWFIRGLVAGGEK